MNFTFDGSMSREVLNNYLSRAVTHAGIGMDNNACSRTFEDDLRMLKNEGAKFIGRASYVWGSTDEAHHFAFAKERAARAHEVDPEFILQACVFECISKKFVDSIPVPAWVFEAFGLSAEDRCFSHEAMLFPGGIFKDKWGKDSSVEDITRLESRMYMYYRACSYINAGFEAIHFGQVHLIGVRDKDYRYWKELLTMVRGYAKVHARRRFVLCDAHTHGIAVDGELLFDFHAWPLRLKEIIDSPMEAELEENYLDSIFGHSLGGKTPSGWICDSLPFLVEFDNFGKAPWAGQPRHDSYYVWGYDEITWYALKTKEQRHAFLRYVRNWVNERCPEGWVQMPSRRCMKMEIAFVWERPDTAWLDGVAKEEFLTYTLDGDGKAHILRNYYSANRQSDACPFGYGDEDVVKELFEEGN